MKQKLILHIGQSKTGTTAIQDHLARNRSNLLKEGYLYPRVTRGGVPLDILNHNGFADSLVRPTTYPKLSAEEYFSQFRRQISNSDCHTVILSAEHFFGGLPRVWEVESLEEYREIYVNKLRKLKEFTDQFETNIICYLRPQASWLSSSLNQNIKTSGLIDLSRNFYVSDRHFYEISKYTLRYSETLSLWMQVVKPESLTAVPYDRTTLISNNSISDFEERTGLKNLQLTKSKNFNKNQSLTIEYLELKKILNDKTRSKAKERTIIKALVQLSTQSSLSDRYMLDPEVIKDLLDYTHQDNLLLSQKFMRDGRSLHALSGYDVGMLRRPTEQEVHHASKTFRRHMRSPPILIHTKLVWIKSMLRRYAPGLHSAMNIAKGKLSRLK